MHSRSERLARYVDDIWLLVLLSENHRDAKLQDVASLPPLLLRVNLRFRASNIDLLDHRNW